MRKNTWSKKIQISAVLTASVECPECRGAHTVQQELKPDDPEDESMIMEDPWFVRPCPDCQTDLIYHFDISLRAWARIHEKRFEREPDPKKQEPQQLAIF